MAMDAMDVVESLGSHFTLAMKGPDALGVPFSSWYCFRFHRNTAVTLVHQSPKWIRK